MTRRRSPRPEALTPEELEQWQKFVATARPLRGRHRPLPDPPPLARERESDGAAPTPSPAKRGRAGEGAVPHPPQRPPPPLEIGHHPPGVDNTRWGGLSRGKLKAERRLDLHGLTLARAHAATRAFIEAGERGEGRIRAEFMHWINAPDLRGRVLAAAHPHRANAGSVRLLLRRKR